MINKKVIILDLENHKNKRMNITFPTKLDFKKFCIENAIGTFYHYDGTQSAICLKKKED